MRSPTTQIQPRPAPGFSIIEALISIAVFGVLAAGTLSLVWGPVTAASAAREHSRAVYLADEGIEAVRSIRNDGWMRLVAGDHGLDRTGGAWSFIGTGDQTTDGNMVYDRSVRIEAVNRDLSGNIVTSGGSPDPRTKKATVTVSWTSAFGTPRSLAVSAFLTHWNAYDWRQSTDSDFNAGTRNQTQISGSGEAAVVELSTGMVKTWTPREGQSRMHTADTDWVGGNFTDTLISGSGLPAVIEAHGTPKWLVKTTGSNQFQTTNTDFITGTPNFTKIVGTGDPSYITLDTITDWAAMASPVADHLRAVSFVSSVDGFAVGAGGRILRYNGEGWSIFTSPTANQLNVIDMVSAADGYAVGTNGAAIRWNGTAWNNLPSIGTTMNGLYMLSSTDGWAVGNSGKIFRWNGTAWNQFVDTGTATWTSVWMVSATDGWVVSSGGDIFRWNGTAWSVVTSPTKKSLLGISCASASLCFAVGAQGTIIRWNGTAWSAAASPTVNGLNGVHLLSSNFGFAVGASGSLIQWNGTAWSSVAPPSATQMNAVVILSSEEAYVVGNSGTIWQYGGHYRSSGTYESQVLDSLVSVDWGHIYWNERLALNSNLTIAVRTGNTPAPDGTWTAWGAELTDPTGSTITSPNSRYIQYRATLTTSDKFVAPQLDSVSISYNETADVSFFDVVKMTATDGWSVGQGGALSRFDGINWTTYTPSPTTDSLLGVDFADANNVWAVGYGGRIIRWNGTTWSTSTPLTSRTLNGIDVLSATSAFVAGSNGTLLRLSGTTWSLLASPTVKNLNNIAMVSDSDGWAVGDNGTILHWNGSAWSLYASPTSASLNSISMVSADFGVIVGSGGLTLHWNGTSWTQVVSSTPNELRDVSCLSPADCWAVGVEQTFIQWDGTSWSQYVFSNQANPVVQGIYMFYSTDVTSVGEGGANYEYGAAFTSPSYYESPVVDSGLADTMWNTVSWSSLQPMYTGLTVATRTGPTLTPDGSWSAWSSEYTDPGGTNITSPIGQYLQYRLTFTTSDPAEMPVVEDVRLMYGAVTGQDLFGIDGTAVGDVWSVGRAGQIIHYDGIEWSKASSPVSVTLNDVDAVTAADAYAVGGQGNILRWNGTAWLSQSSPTTNDLFSLHMVSGAFGAAVGSYGTIVHWDGTSWSIVASPVTTTLRGVHLFDASTGFAVGDGGVILRWDGASWTTASSPVVTRLNSVHLIAANYGWAVGDGGVILKWDGTSWSGVASPAAVRLNAVESRSTAEAWAVGDSGAIIQWDGSAWTSFVSPTTRNLYGLTVEAPTSGWICGRNGSLLKDPPVYASYGVFLSNVLDTGFAGAAWDAVYFSAVKPPATDLTVAFRSGNTLIPDASWSEWSPEISVMTGADILPPPARYLQYRLSLTTGDVSMSPALDDITITYRQ